MVRPRQCSDGQCIHDEVFSVGRRILSDRWSLCHLQQKLFKEHSSSNEIVTFQRKLEYISNFKFSRMDVELWAYNSFHTQSVSASTTLCIWQYAVCRFRLWEQSSRKHQSIKFSNLDFLLSQRFTLNDLHNNLSWYHYHAIDHLTINYLVELMDSHIFINSSSD